MVIAWLLYNDCMLIVWLLCGYCIVIDNYCIVIVWFLYGYCIVIVRLPCGCCMVFLYCYCMAIVWLLYGQSLRGYYFWIIKLAGKIVGCACIARTKGLNTRPFELRSFAQQMQAQPTNAGAIILHGQCMATVWLLYCCCMVAAWLFYGYCVVNAWLLHGYCMGIV